LLHISELLDEKGHLLQISGLKFGKCYIFLNFRLEKGQLLHISRLKMASVTHFGTSG
jgi:hypothetical protein